MELSFDMSGFLNAYNRGVEDAFLAMYDFSEFESYLECNGIVTQSDDDKYDI